MGCRPPSIAHRKHRKSAACHLHLSASKSTRPSECRGLGIPIRPVMRCGCKGHCKRTQQACIATCSSTPVSLCASTMLNWRGIIKATIKPFNTHKSSVLRQQRSCTHLHAAKAIGPEDPFGPRTWNRNTVNTLNQSRNHCRPPGKYLGSQHERQKL